MLAATLFALAACTDAPPPQARPDRVVLFYDYAGAWAATAGDACARQIELSDGVFLSIAPDPDGDHNRFYADGFFMVEPEATARALPGQVEGDGTLELAIETSANSAERGAEITYRLRLAAQDPYHVRVTSFRRTLRKITASGETRTETVELLGNDELADTVPVLATAGERGLCLRRL